jgi:hypothetical protein
MNETQEVKHYQVNGKYRMVIERIGSAKGTLGFKVEVSGDDIPSVTTDLDNLKKVAEGIAGLPVVEEKKEAK